MILEQLRGLGADVSDLSCYDPDSTHLLCIKPTTNEKSLAHMAAGKWILHVSYVQDSINAGKFLDVSEVLNFEEEFSLHDKNSGYMRISKY